MVKKSVFVRKGVFSTLFLLISISGCVFLISKVEVETEVTDSVVRTPVKVHLKDGRTALFKSGAIFNADSVFGDGYLYSVNLDQARSVSMLSREDIAAYEVFTSKVQVGESVGVSLFASGVAAVATPYLLIAIFGSCPTVYYEADSTMVLESELFSNSIAPMLETRDVAVTNIPSSTSGVIEMEVRNEALETHYINQLELLEVMHQPNEKIVSTRQGTPLTLKAFSELVSAKTASGEDITMELSERDGRSYEYDIPVNNDPEGIEWDHIELVYSPTEHKTGALYMRLRNSLFSTILLYDHILSSQGTGAMDWIGKEMQNVSEVVALGDFFHTYTGIRVDLMIGGEYEEITRVANTGPIAWREIAVPIFDIPTEDSVRIRLRFPADSWRIDEAGFATDFEMPEVNIIPVSKIQNSRGSGSSVEDLKKIREGDESYLITYPGDSYKITYNTSLVPPGMEASYLLAGQGFYIEWIRDKWIEDVKEPEPLDYSPEIIHKAQQEWQLRKVDFEREFFESKVSTQ